MHRSRSSWCALFALIWLCFPAAKVFANTSPGFACSPVFPENQMGEKGFFDLSVEAGQEQELLVDIINLQDEPLRVTVALSNATTTESGEISYTEEGEPDPTMEHPFTEIAEVSEPSLEIPPGETGQAVVHLQIPQSGFDGIILGSIRIYGNLEGDDADISEKNNAARMKIQNRFQYAFPVRLDADNEPVSPVFEVGSASARLLHSQPSVVLELRNAAPLLVKGLSIQGRLYYGEEPEPLLTRQAEDFSVAPHSTLAFGFSHEDGKSFEPGNYRIEAEVYFAGQRWDMEQTLQIDSALSLQMKENAIVAPNQQIRQRLRYALRRTPIWGIVAATAVVVALVFIIVGFLHVWRGNRKLELYLRETVGSGTQQHHPKQDK